jgi:hypothetical protein
MKNALTTLFESSESRVSIHQAEVSVNIYTTDYTLSFRSRGKTYSTVMYPNGELHHCGMNKISYA